MNNEPEYCPPNSSRGILYDHKLFYYEDELPPDYPYDDMFPYSWVDIVRLFPGDEFVRGWQARAQSDGQLAQETAARNLILELRAIVGEEPDHIGETITLPEDRGQHYLKRRERTWTGHQIVQILEKIDQSQP